MSNSRGAQQQSCPAPRSSKLAPSEPDAGGGVVDGIIASLNSIDAGACGGDEEARIRLHAAARKLLARLETPFDRVWSLTYEYPIVHAALQTCTDLAFGKPGTGQAAATRRLLRLLVSVDILEETGVDRYRRNEFTQALGDDKTQVPDSMLLGTHHMLDTGRNLPAFLEKTGYREPLDAARTNYHEINPEKKDYFAYCEAHPEYARSFWAFMSSWTTLKTPWTEVYDTTRLVKGAQESGPLLVDVGGNVGVDISRFLGRHPHAPRGSLVLQDRPEVVATAKVDDSIKVMAHDFFTPQPVKGSRAYFLHAVLHDWPDAEAQQILRNLRDAMTPGYSRLLVCEMVLPRTGASVSQAVMDMQMMSCVSAFERTETAWAKLLSESGFSILRFWPDSRGIETVIEAEVADPITPRL